MYLRMLAIVAPLLLVGCTELQFLSRDSAGLSANTAPAFDQSGPPRMSPLGGDVQSAATIGEAAGGVLEVSEPETGTLQKVRVLAVYRAASGRMCRGYESLGSETRGRGGLVCRGVDGVWRQARLLVEPRLLGH